MSFIGSVLTPNDRVVVANKPGAGFALDLANMLGQRENPLLLLDNIVWDDGEYCPVFSTDRFDRFARENGKSLEGKVVYIVSVPSGTFSKQDLAMRNLFIAFGAKHICGAEGVVLVSPDLFYSAEDRSDRTPLWVDAISSEHNLRRLKDPDELAKMKGHCHTSLAYATFLKAAGVDRVINLHNHSSEIMRAMYHHVFDDSSAFVDIYVSSLLGAYVADTPLLDQSNDGANVLWVCPDGGARPFVEAARKDSGLTKSALAVMGKKRDKAGKIIGYELVDGNDYFDPDRGVRNMDVVEPDDRIRSGKTMALGCGYFCDNGQRPRKWMLYSSHTNLAKALANLDHPSITDIVVLGADPTIRNGSRLAHKLSHIDAIAPVAYGIEQCVERGLHPSEAFSLAQVREHRLLSYEPSPFHYSNF